VVQVWRQVPLTQVVLPVQPGPVPQTHVPLLQVFPLVQVPQESVPPQPLDGEPQVAPSWLQVVGVQPHTPDVPPPPQVLGDVQQAAQVALVQQAALLALHAQVAQL
jgi:hypothetical protein